LLEALKQVNPDQLPNETRILLTSTLRDILSWHEESDEAEGEAGDARLKPLYDLQRRLEPLDPLFKYMWLFIGWPRLARGTNVDYEEEERQVHEAQVGGLRVIFAAHGIEGLLKLCEMSDRPDLVGWRSAELRLEAADESDLLHKTLSIRPTKQHLEPRLRMGIGYVSSASRLGGESWIEQAVTHLTITWSTEMRANFAWGLPPGGKTWDFVESLGSEVSDLYWSRTPIDMVPDPNDAERAVRSLLGANRPYRAIYVADQWIRHPKGQSASNSGLPFDLIRDVLTEAPRHDPAAEWFTPGLNMLVYHVESLLAVLEKANEQPTRLALLEWSWMPVLARGQRGLKALQRALSIEPELFIDLLKATFRGEGEEERQLTEDERSRASQARKLLAEWRRVPGTIDSSEAGQEEEGQPELSKSVEGDIPFPSGRIDEKELNDWVLKARNLAQQSGRLELCDKQIGRVLAYAPDDEAGVWPCLAVRNLVESLSSEALERGIWRGVVSKRGTHYRAAGGAQERALAAKFLNFAEHVSPKWPRTGAILFSLANLYEKEGKRQDDQAEFEEFE